MIGDDRDFEIQILTYDFPADALGGLGIWAIIDWVSL